MSEPSRVGGKSCGDTATLQSCQETNVLRRDAVVLQVAKGVCIPSRTLDGAKL